MKTETRKCHDCGIELVIKNGKIVGGVGLSYKGYEYPVFKCSDCYAKNKSLENYQTCEVYSRVVGYLRPVQQWNKGKQEEFETRVNYKEKSNPKLG